MTVWSTKDQLIFQMKMKTKCSFYLPVEFPLTASLTRAGRIDRRPAAEGRLRLPGGRANGKLSYQALRGAISVPAAVMYVRPAGWGHF